MLHTKIIYALHMLIICDIVIRIIYHVVQSLRSASGNREWRKFKLKVRLLKFLEKIQYILTDSAFTISSIVVLAFQNTNCDHISCTEHALTARFYRSNIKYEHCIVLLKGSFPWLQNVRIRIKNKAILKKSCFYVKACNITQMR